MYCCLWTGCKAMTKINKHFKYVKKKIDKIVLYYENRFSNVKHIVFLLNGSVKLNKIIYSANFWMVCLCSKKYFMGCFTDQLEFLYISEKLMNLLFNMGMSFETVTGCIHIYSYGNDGKFIVTRVIFKKNWLYVHDN